MSLFALGCNALTGASRLSILDDDDVAATDAGRQTDASLAAADGGLAADAADAADTADSARNEAGTAPKRVFVTSSSTTADLGGVGGADAKCTAAAALAGIGGTWTALLSVQGAVDARDRPNAAGPWHLVTGELAVTKVQLSNNPITRAINRDENGGLVTSGFVWTGTGGSGRFFDDDCAGWTTNAAAAHASTGDPTRTNSSWLAARPGDCAEQNRLYCFEQ